MSESVESVEREYRLAKWAKRNRHGITGSCGVCLFWDRLELQPAGDFQEQGLCRRRAPNAVASISVAGDGTGDDGMGGLPAAWPRTSEESDWCGEYVSHVDYDGDDRLISTTDAPRP